MSHDDDGRDGLVHVGDSPLDVPGVGRKLTAPQSKGGSDHFDNLQLLCGACNSVKVDRDHAVLIATLQERGVLPAS